MDTEQSEDETSKKELKDIDTFSTPYFATMEHYIKILSTITNDPELLEGNLKISDLVSELRRTIENKNDQNSGLMIIAIKILFYIYSHYHKDIKYCVLIIMESILNLVVHFFKSDVPENDNTDTETKKKFKLITAKIKKMGTFVDDVDRERHVDEHLIDLLTKNVDIFIGIETIEELRHNILSHMTGKKSDLEKCPDYLTMFLRLSTLRHSLLLGYKICLELKGISLAVRNVLQKTIDRERKELFEFLEKFALPSLENVGILLTFDPTIHQELATYLTEMRLLPPDLSKLLTGKVCMIASSLPISTSLGRPFSFFREVRGMNVSCTNVRIQYLFTAVENSFNTFYIESPDVGEYLYMTESTRCKYGKRCCDTETKQWRIVQIYQKKGSPGNPSFFVLSTKKWPEKILFIEKSYWMSAIGLRNTAKPTAANLFTITPLNCSPLMVPMPIPELLTEALTINEMATMSAITTESCNAETNHFQTIRVFLERRGYEVTEEIVVIESFDLQNKNSEFNESMIKVANTLSSLSGGKFTEEMMNGLLEMISISFDLSKKKMVFGSILRPILRVYGLVLSCIWQTSGIDDFVCQSFEKNEEIRHIISKDIYNLLCVSLGVTKVECAKNITERNIADMMNTKLILEELECLLHLRRKASENQELIVTFVMINILQQAIFWRMYAVANLPGHSSTHAKHMLRFILMQKQKDLAFIKSCKCSPGPTAMLVERYLTCMGCDHDFPVTEEETIGRLAVLLLVVVPYLDALNERRIHDMN